MNSHPGRCIRGRSVPVAAGCVLVFILILGGARPARVVAQEGAGSPAPDQLLLKDYRPRAIHRVPVTRVDRARYPVIDMHSHAYVRTQDQVDAWVRTMDELGVERTVILSGATGGEFDAVLARFARHKDRFSVWCGFRHVPHHLPHPGDGG